MKPIAILFLATVLCAGPVQARMLIDGGAGVAGRVVPVPAKQGAKVDAIYGGASKLVIGGVTYAYNPLTTAVTVNGRRSTMSDIRVGDTVQFRAEAQGKYQPALLTSISVQQQ